MGTTTLKDQNRLGLVTAFLANVAVFLVLSLNLAIPLSGKSEWQFNWLTITPGLLGAVLVGVLNGQLDALTKARIVYLRYKDPLPGSRAFSKLIYTDPRIDPDALRTKVGAFPEDAAGQNRLWYRLYLAAKDAPQILHANKEYLFTRDFHVMSIAFLFVFGGLSIWTIEHNATRALYLFGLLLQYLATGQAARVHGGRLVCSVLALSPHETSKGETK